MTMTANEALRSIPLTSMSKAELLALNVAVVNQIRQLQTIETIRAGSSLRVGEFCLFYSSRQQRTVKVRVDKVNVKTASVTELNSDGSASPFRWKVSPQLLKPC